MWKGLIAGALLAGCIAVPSARADAVTSCARTESDGSRTLCHELVIAAAQADVWALLSTSAGLRSWAAPVAAIELRIGGIWEASYRRDARLGDANNIRNRVISFVPERMLSIQVDHAPPGFPHADIVGQLWTVTELEPVDATHTRVRVRMLGYRDGAGFNQLYRFFEQGNAYTLQKLNERVSVGPVDWARATPPIPRSEAPAGE